MKIEQKLIFLPLLCLLIAASAPSRAADLTRFLPANGNCVYEASGLLRSWPAGGPRKLWSVQIGLGKSAVVEAGGRAYTMTQLEDKKQYAVCLNPLTGKTIWQKLLVNNDNHHQVKGPVSSPVIDGDRVYFIPYGNENNNMWYPHCAVFCLRARDGGEVWHEGTKFWSTEGSTPLIVGDTLYIASTGRDAALVAVDKLTGRLLWKTGDPVDAGYKIMYGAGSSLTYMEFKGVPMIVEGVFRNDQIGVNAKTGELLWHWKFPTPMSSGMVSSPVAIGSAVFFSGFQRGNAWGACLDIVTTGTGIGPKVRYCDPKLQCNAYHTVSIFGGAVYGFGTGKETDALQCTDFETGKLLWAQEGPDWGKDRNLVVADGLIFAITRKDELVLAEANKTGYKELGRVSPGIKLGIPQQPTIANGRLYLRGEDTIVCYEIGGK